MIDFDDDETQWWMREIDSAVNTLQFLWDEITVDSLMSELNSMYELSDTMLSDEIFEMCETYLYQRFNDPFGGLYAPMEISEFSRINQRGKVALFKALATRRKLLKAHIAEVDAYVKTVFG